MNRFAKSGYLFPALIIVAAVLLLDSLQPANGQGAGRPKPTDNKASKPKRNSTGRTSARERRRRELAEAEASEIRAAQEREEQEKREKEQVWMVAILRNKTERPIAYKCNCGGSWTDGNIAPEKGFIYTTRDKAVVIKFQSGSQEKRYRLQATSVVGRRPTESDEKKARVNYFDVDADGDIQLYAEPLSSSP